MNNNKKIKTEYERLKKLFASVDPTKTELVDNLLNEAAFMKIQLLNLQEQIKKYGAIQISSKGNQRQTEAAKYYTKLVNSYGTVIKTLNAIMGKNVMDEDDEFDKLAFGKLKMSNLEIAINGVKIASKILNIPEPEVYFITAANLPNKEITAIFLFDEYEIIFNEDWVMNVPWIEVMVTCFHESRHAYQAYSINNEVNENDKTLMLWKKEFDSYNNPTGDNTPISDVEYLRQSIEVDAIRFAHEKVKELFNVKTIVPDEIKDLVF